MGEEPTMSYNGDVPDPTPPLAPALDTGDSRHTKRVLLVWDAPNLDMGLGAILGTAHAHQPLVALAGAHRRHHVY